MVKNRKITKVPKLKITKEMRERNKILKARLCENFEEFANRLLINGPVLAGDFFDRLSMDGRFTKENFDLITRYHFFARNHLFIKRFDGKIGFFCDVPFELFPEWKQLERDE